jgi:hypothetical protein
MCTYLADLTESDIKKIASRAYPGVIGAKFLESKGLYSTGEDEDWFKTYIIALLKDDNAVDQKYIRVSAGLIAEVDNNNSVVKVLHQSILHRVCV